MMQVVLHAHTCGVQIKCSKQEINSHSRQTTFYKVGDNATTNVTQCFVSAETAKLLYEFNCGFLCYNTVQSGTSLPKFCRQKPRRLVVPSYGVITHETTI